MSYAQAMRHRPHRLNIGHTFNPSGIQWTPKREPEPRVRCPGCGNKYGARVVCWVPSNGQGERMCKRCSTKRAALAAAEGVQ